MSTRLNSGKDVVSRIRKSCMYHIVLFLAVAQNILFVRFWIVTQSGHGAHAKGRDQGQAPREIWPYLRQIWHSEAGRTARVRRYFLFFYNPYYHLLLVLFPFFPLCSPVSTSPSYARTPQLLTSGDAQEATAGHGPWRQWFNGILLLNIRS